MFDNNAVHSFERSSRKAKVLEFPSKESIAKKKRSEKLKFCAKCVSLLLTSATLVGGFLFGQAVLFECTSALSVETAKLEEYQNRNRQLEMKLGTLKSSKELVQEGNDELVETVVVSSGDKAKIS